MILLALLLANPLDLYGFTPRGTAMAGALTASDGLTAAFYNPAAMSLVEGSTLAIGLGDTVPALHIDRALVQSQVESAMPEAAPRLELGAITSLGARLRFGAALSFPTNRLLRLENLESARPQFLLYQSKPQRFVVVANLAAKLTSRLSVGGGLSVSQSQSGLYKFGLDVPDRTVTVREEQVDATFTPGFNAGVIVQARDDLRVGFTWRSAQSQHTDVPTEFELQGLGSLLVQTAGTTLYWPHVFSLGAEWRRGPLRLCAQADVMLWSLAPSEELQFAILPTGQVLTSSGLADLLTYNAPPRPAGFHSVLVPRVAAEWLSGQWTLRGGLAYRPPVTPAQSAVSSYLDNPTLQVGAGAAYQVAAGVALEAALGATVLLERTMHKASAYNATGDASFGGSLWTGSAMARYEY